MGSSVEGVLSVCPNGTALLNNMAAMPIYGNKHLNIFFSRNRKAVRLNLGILHPGRKVYQFCSNDDARISFDFFTAWSNFSPSCFGKNWKNVARHLQICNGCFTQVSKSWPIGLSFLDNIVSYMWHPYPYLKFPKDSVQLRITPKKILCGVLGHLLRSNFLLKNGKQSGECVNLYDYHHIWNELRTFVTSRVLGWNFCMLTHIYHSYLA